MATNDLGKGVALVGGVTGLAALALVLWATGVINDVAVLVALVVLGLAARGMSVLLDFSWTRSLDRRAASRKPDGSDGPPHSG